MNRRYAGVLVSTGLAVVLYLNTLNAGFAYDDSRAIQKNQDLEPQTPLWNIFYNDFWGTPLTHSGSHKSYRPLCVLTFRLNYYLAGLEPWGYHLGNVLCHALATATFSWCVTQILGDGIGSLAAGLLFASHPVHTEAVAGVVGRADVLACFLFLLTLMMYAHYVKLRESRVGLIHRLLPALGVGLLSAAAMLSKEQALTVLAICAVYDIVVVHRATVKDVLYFRFLTQKRFHSCLEGLFLLTGCGLSLLTFRIMFMGNKPPEFAPSDNPASDSDSWVTRTLTYSYLPLVNVWLLLCPRVLSFDWSMDSIPLVESLGDIRVYITAVFYACLVYLFTYIARTLENHPSPAITTDERSGVTVPNNRTNSVHTNGSAGHSSQNHGSNNNGFAKSGYHKLSPPNLNALTSEKFQVAPGVLFRNVDILVLAIAVIVFPFIPASNLFFYVGFVVAERILYIPSMGACLLVGLGVQRIFHYTEEKWRKPVLAGLVVLVVCFSSKTVLRNQDWFNEERLYTAGVAVNPAKAWGNLANVFNDKQETDKAEAAYRNALKHRPNMADVHYNLGILLQNQKRLDEAIKSYQNAINFRPKLTVAYLNYGILLAQIGKTAEAKEIYEKCANLDTAGLKDPKLHDGTKISCLFNHGRLLMDEGRLQEALRMFNEANARKPDHYGAQSIYNMMGEIYFKQNNIAEAEKWYKEALIAKPDHIPAHLTMSKVSQVKGNFKEALEWLEKAEKISPNDHTIEYHKAQFFVGQNQMQAAKEIYDRLLPVKEDDFEVVYNAANLYRQINDNQKAEELYIKAANLQPSEPTAWMNLGAMLHMNQKYQRAEQAYLKAAELDPNNKVNLDNLNRLRKTMAQRNL